MKPLWISILSMFSIFSLCTRAEEPFIKSDIFETRSLLEFGYSLSFGFDDLPSSTQLQTFSKDEIRLIFKILRKLPPQLHFLRGMSGLVRLQSTASYEGFAQSAAIARSAETNELGVIHSRGDILLTDLFFLQSSKMQELTLAHELCHHLDYQPLYLGRPPHSIDESEEFHRLSRSSAGYVSYYASQGGVYEDFAESCAFYIVDQKRLRFMSNKKFHYFQKLMKKYSRVPKNS